MSNVWRLYDNARIWSVVLVLGGLAVTYFSLGCISWLTFSQTVARLGLERIYHLVREENDFILDKKVQFFWHRLWKAKPGVPYASLRLMLTPCLVSHIISVRQFGMVSSAHSYYKTSSALLLFFWPWLCFSCLLLDVFHLRFFFIVPYKTIDIPNYRCSFFKSETIMLKYPKG